MKTTMPRSVARATAGALATMLAMSSVLPRLPPAYGSEGPAATEGVSKDDASDASKGDAPADNASIHRALDGYLDRRWLSDEDAARETEKLLELLGDAGSTPADVEELLRAGRASYEAPPPPGKLVLVQGLACEHVDYTTSFFLFVPESCDPARPAPLLLVGHGGNSAMSVEYAKQAALGGTVPWLPVVGAKGMVLAAPLSERGWGPIGNSILLSLVSWLQRRVHIDPDRIHVTGHSMGGHLGWRSAIQLCDRWGAVAPMSGGYDYVDDKQVHLLVNVPGYATFGAKEPYDINRFNKKIAGWMAEHAFDWKLVEKPGGHEIYADELPRAADFLLARPRNLYRPRVYAVGGKSVVFDATWKNDKWPAHTWNPRRPIPRSTFHWIRLYPQPEDTPDEKTPQRVWAENLGENRIRITSQHARRLRVYLHPKMVDFDRPVEVVANGETVFRGKVRPSLRTLLELVREFDDRGRIFHAAVEVEIPTDEAVPEPRG